MSDCPWIPLLFSECSLPSDLCLTPSLIELHNGKVKQHCVSCLIGLNGFRDRTALMTDSEAQDNWAKRFLCSYHRWTSANHMATGFRTRSWPRAELGNLFILSKTHIATALCIWASAVKVYILKRAFCSVSFWCTDVTALIVTAETRQLVFH